MDGVQRRLQTCAVPWLRRCIPWVVNGLTLRYTSSLFAFIHYRYSIFHSCLISSSSIRDRVSSWAVRREACHLHSVFWFQPRQAASLVLQIVSCCHFHLSTKVLPSSFCFLLSPCSASCLLSQHYSMVVSPSYAAVGPTQIIFFRISMLQLHSGIFPHS